MKLIKKIIVASVLGASLFGLQAFARGGGGGGGHAGGGGFAGGAAGHGSIGMARGGGRAGELCTNAIASKTMHNLKQMEDLRFIQDKKPPANIASNGNNCNK